VSRVETKLVDRKKPALRLSGSTTRAPGNRGSSTVTKCSLAILVVGLRPLIGQSQNSSIYPVSHRGGPCDPVVGPMNKFECARESQRLGLPEFTRVVVVLVHDVVRRRWIDALVKISTHVAIETRAAFC
jgi:hypothetical protein